MIKFIKGKMLSKEYRLPVDACVFMFRDKTIKFEWNETNEYKPLDAFELFKADVEFLLEWLELCLQDKRCDDCAVLKIPEVFDIDGEVKCKNCGEIYIK